MTNEIKNYSVRIEHGAYSDECCFDGYRTEREAKRAVSEFQQKAGHGWTAIVRLDGRVIAQRSYGASRFTSVNY